MSVQGGLSFGVIGAFVGVVLIWIFHPPTGDPNSIAVLNTLTGTLAAAFMAVVNFHFGSSAGSKDKDDTIGRMAVGKPPALPNVPTPTTATIPENRSDPMSRRVIALTACLLALAGTQAFAADIPAVISKGPAYVPVTAAWSWDGCYLGAGGGMAAGMHKYEFLTSPGNGDLNTIAAALGPQLGCRYQTSGGPTIGFEGSLDYNFVRGDSNTIVNRIPTGVEVSKQWLGLATVGAGIPLGAFNSQVASTALGKSLPGQIKGVIPSGNATYDAALFEVIGGLAVGHQRTTFSAFGEEDVTKVGWTVGARFSLPITANLIVALQYNYVDLGHFECSTDCGILRDTAMGETKIHVGRASASYKF